MANLFFVAAEFDVVMTLPSCRLVTEVLRKWMTGLARREDELRSQTCPGLDDHSHGGTNGMLIRVRMTVEAQIDRKIVAARGEWPYRENRS